MGLRDRLKGREWPARRARRPSAPADPPLVRDRPPRRGGHLAGDLPGAQGRAAPAADREAGPRARSSKLPREQLREELRVILASLLRGHRAAAQPHRARADGRGAARRGHGPRARSSRCCATPRSPTSWSTPLDTVYVERFGKLELTDDPLPRQRPPHPDHQPHRLARRAAASTSRRRWSTPACPTARASTPSSRRWRSTARSLSIRRFGGRRCGCEDLVAHRQHHARDGRSCWARACKAKCNMLISGGTGTGKTTMLNALSSFIPDERAHRHHRGRGRAAAAAARTSCAWRRGRPTSRARARSLARDLVRNSLRMRPDRIVVGEVRGGEVLDMLQAMNTGHEGSMTTVHANTPRDALSRIEAMVGMSGVQHVRDPRCARPSPAR